MYESGKRTPKDENLEKIAAALQVDPWALKDLDIDMNDHTRRQYYPCAASVYYLLFLLNEKGLFDIDDVDIELEYVDHSPQYKISFHADEALFNFFGEWKCIVSEDVLTDTTLNNWKIDPFPFSEWERFSRFLQLGKVSGRQMVTTASLLEGGFDFSYIYLDALARGCCTEEDILAILKLFDEDPTFKDSQNAIDCLTAFFAEGLIPDSCLDKAFHEVDQYGASLIQKGAVRHAYETSQKLSPEEQEHYRDTLRASLKEYHDSELKTL